MPAGAPTPACYDLRAMLRYWLVDLPAAVVDAVLLIYRYLYVAMILVTATMVLWFAVTGPPRRDTPRPSPAPSHLPTAPPR